jgi:hypothetical protein
MSKEFYDAESLLAVCKSIKLKKCSTCGSFLLDTHAHCKTCEMKFIVDLLEVFPKSNVQIESEVANNDTYKRTSD